jgi:hypothetical protein
MPTYEQITSAREKSKRIRECGVSFLRKRGELQELLARIAELELKTEGKKDLRRGRTS